MLLLLAPAGRPRGREDEVMGTSKRLEGARAQPCCPRAAAGAQSSTDSRQLRGQALSATVSAEPWKPLELGLWKMGPLRQL